MRKNNKLILGMVGVTAVIILVYLLIMGNNEELIVSTSVKESQETVQVLSEETEENPLEISIGMWDAQRDLVGDDLQKLVEEKFNIKLVPVPVTYMNWMDEFQKMAATRELPDIISHDIVGTVTYKTWIEQELVQKIPNDLTKYPNLESYMKQDYQSYFRDEQGDIYCIPRITYQKEEMWALDRCVIIRTDWLDKLGLEMPQSFEEFENVLKLFVTEDPDGNGLDDTCGLSIANVNLFETIYLSIFPELANVEKGWIKEDGKWMPVYCSKKTGEALSYAKRLYDLGLLDSEFAYQSSTDGRAKFAEGKSGAVATQWMDMAILWDEFNPNREITQVAKVMRPWPAEDGNRYRFTSSLHWSESYINRDISNEKLEKILQLYDYLLSDEFGELLEEYPLNENPSADLLSVMVEWNQELEYENRGKYKGRFSQETLRYANDELAWFVNNTKRLDYNWNIIFMDTEHKNKLPSYGAVQDEMVKVMVGNEDAEDAWEKALSQLKEQTPLDQTIEEVTRIAEKNGW